ncbi:sigma-70 family RNA polymerase sigma factor [Nocardioides hwasunensis]|uniref:Sigma-70 family RNA polymerase sigma factor n=1 Tax=Nocardioides hwasunensis TaxID=397258 RepID=A0ABR8MK94_9ACTN|nr:sigma-70 family RNA polymerase sigma factor [Nocardioides hwasunensis]MBD3915706.1 sigma-70 family RNA polymerase sigma factor [Nocardioides hwasunensis]
MVPVRLVPDRVVRTEARTTDQLIEDHVRVARSMAARYRGRGIDLDDLEQVALLGLTKAAHRFDPEAGHEFMSYAAPTVRGELRRYFRDHGWMVRPPRRVQENQARITHARDDLAARLGRSPRPSELAEHLGAELADIEEALAADGCFTPSSLDTPVGEGDTTLGELLAGDDRGLVQAEARAVLAPVVGRLSQRDREIVGLRFRDELTQRQIAAEVGLTQAQVSRVLTRALAEMRAGLLGRTSAA